MNFYFREPKVGDRITGSGYSGTIVDVYIRHSKITFDILWDDMTAPCKRFTVEDDGPRLTYLAITRTYVRKY